LLEWRETWESTGQPFGLAMREAQNHADNAPLALS